MYRNKRLETNNETNIWQWNFSRKQSSNFIFDTSNSELDLGSLTNQVQELYSRKDLSFIRKIILKNKNEVKVYKRK